MSQASFGWTAYSPVTDHPDAPPDSPPELADLRRLARRAVNRMVSTARAEETPGFGALIREHLGLAAGEAVTLTQSWPGYDAVNIQAALDAWRAQPGRRSELVGVTNFRHRMFGLPDLLVDAPDARGVAPGAAARSPLATGPSGQTLSCVTCGVYLVNDDEGAAVLLQRAPEPHSGTRGATVEVMAASMDQCRSITAALKRLAQDHNVFRGHYLSFEGEMFNAEDSVLNFLPRPAVARSDVILPEETLTAALRQVTGISDHRDRLLAMGQHLKRGLLLFGPPGTGKTHLLRHLIGTLPQATVIELSGETVHMIRAACSVARELQPSVVIVEDVDLIGEDRGMHPGSHPFLFQLLGEMDGLDGDADIVFLLTTNRADLLEPALAARPGRVDQALELGLPGLTERRRLFELYSKELTLDATADQLDQLLVRLEGVTASFIKELVRRAALFSAEASSEAVTADHLTAALNELLETRNQMTRIIVGGGQLDSTDQEEA